VITKADIKLIRSLADKTARVESGLFAVEGDKMVSEAIASGFGVERVFVTSKSGLPAQTGMLAPEVVPEKDMERISHLKTPSVSLALVRIPKHGFSAGIFRGGLVLALDGVQDPGNLGTIIRIADWFGIADILCSPATADRFNPKVVQATMGALFRVGLHYVELAETLAEAAKSGTEIYGAFLEGENIYDAPLGGNGSENSNGSANANASTKTNAVTDTDANAHTGVIVMGNEGRGISPAVAQTVTRKLFIPPYPAGRHGSESLNVAAATAVICSEFRRRN
jgi:TrmH family RNA methyltransferase